MLASPGGGQGTEDTRHAELPTCLGRCASQLLSEGGSAGLEGCTEADMDFWCCRGRAELTAAEAEAVEALEPGVVRLGGGEGRKENTSRGEADV